MRSAEGLRAVPPKVLTQRVIEEFFARVIAEARPINTMTIVSPWISQWESGPVGLERIAEVVQERHIRTLVLTRPPANDWHSNALDILSQAPMVSIYLLENLHAKIFVCEAIPVGFGLVGSANLTAHSLHNHEVAVMFDGRGVLSPLIQQLKALAWYDLRRLSSTKYKPRKGGSFR